MKAQIWRPRIGRVREKVFGAVQWMKRAQTPALPDITPRKAISVFPKFAPAIPPPQEELI